MAKTVLKEIIIMLALCFLVILILAVLLYAYTPNNKIMPEKVSYVAPEEVSQVLQESIQENSQIILTYEIENSDLKNAQKVNDYTPGKVNPFSSYVVEEEEATTDKDGNIISGNATQSEKNNNSTNNTESEGKFFTDKGTK